MLLSQSFPFPHVQMYLSLDIYVLPNWFIASFTFVKQFAYL